MRYGVTEPRHLIPATPRPCPDDAPPRGIRRPFWAGAGQTVKLAVPLMAAQVSVVVLSVLDTVTFGALGTQALAGGGLGATVFNFLNVISVGVLSATAIQVAYASVTDRRALRDIVRAGLLVAVVLGLLAALTGINARPVLLALDQDPTVVAGAARYLAFAAPAIIPSLIFTVLRGLAIGLGKPGPVTAITVVAVVVKALANIAILLTLHDAAPADRAALGLAWAGTVNTVIFGMMAGALWLQCRRRFPAHMGLPRFATFASAHLRELLRLGIPIGFTYGVETGFFTGTALIVGRFGPVAVAANAIALQCATLSFMQAVGLSQAATVRVGQAMGAGAPGEARRIGRQTLALGLVVMGLAALGFSVFGREIAGLIVGRDDTGREEVVTLARQLLLVAACFQLFDGTQNIAMGVLRGLKNTQATMIAAVVGYWIVGLPAAWLMSTRFGPVGAWWGLTIGLVTAAAILVANVEAATRRR